MRKFWPLRLKMSIFLFHNSEFSSSSKVFVNAYHWLFPGGVGDINGGERGQVKSIRQWANHLIHYYDSRFHSDQLFTLYVFNTTQRHNNKQKRGHFFSHPNWPRKIRHLLTSWKIKYVMVISVFFNVNCGTSLSKYVGVMHSEDQRWMRWNHGLIFTFHNIMVHRPIS